MMDEFAKALVRDQPQKEGGEEGLVVDVGITKHPYYADKAAAIAADDKTYRGVEEQVHLLGFDSLIRFLDCKYYPPQHTLECLEGFFAAHKVVVRLRTGDKWGDVQEQRRWVENLGGQGGELERRGGKGEWAERIEIEEEGKEGEEEVISSTKVREAVKRRDEGALKGLVPAEVAEYVLREGLYQDDAE